jgi:hypothetical protein
MLRQIIVDSPNVGWGRSARDHLLRLRGDGRALFLKCSVKDFLSVGIAWLFNTRRVSLGLWPWEIEERNIGEVLYPFEDNFTAIRKNIQEAFKNTVFSDLPTSLLYKRNRRLPC